MKYVMLSVRDSAAGAFGRPVFAASVGLALRSFSDEVNREARDNEMFNHPGDFELFQLGSFDDATGRFELLPVPESVQAGRSVRVQQEVSNASSASRERQ